MSTDLTINTARPNMKLLLAQTILAASNIDSKPSITSADYQIRRLDVKHWLRNNRAGAFDKRTDNIATSPSFPNIGVCDQAWI